MRKIASILTSVAIAIAISGCGKLSEPATTTETKQSVNEAELAKLTEQQFKANTVQIPYNDIARNPEKFKAQNAYFLGKVVQVNQDKKNVTLRVEVTRGKNDLWNDVVWVNYTIPEGQDRILDNDIIQIWGTIKGLQTYTAVLGNKISIPELDAKYISIGLPTEANSTVQTPSTPNPQSAQQTSTPVPAESKAKADGYLYDELVRNYEVSLIDAINARDFSLVEHMLAKGSPLYDAQKKLVDNLGQKGITEELIDYEVIDASTDANKSIYLTVREKIKIIRQDGQSTENFTWVYTVKPDKQGMLQFSDIRKP